MIIDEDILAKTWRDGISDAIEFLKEGVKRGASYEESIQTLELSLLRTAPVKS